MVSEHLGQPEDPEAPAFLPPTSAVINRNAFQTTCLSPEKGKSQEGTAFLANYDQCTMSNQSILEEISPGCPLEGLMLKLKLQYFGHLM